MTAKTASGARRRARRESDADRGEHDTERDRGCEHPLGVAGAGGEEHERESEHPCGDDGVGEKLPAGHAFEGIGPWCAASLPEGISIPPGGTSTSCPREAEIPPPGCRAGAVALVPWWP